MADYATISASENGNDSTDESTSSRILSMIPSTVNLDIFDPSVAQSPKDRILLIAEYCQSWNSFVDISRFNLPPMSAEYKNRFETNIGNFFYNYFVIGIVFLGLYAFFNFSSVLVLLAYAALGYVVYIQYPEDIEIGSTIIDSKAKKIVMGVGLVISLLFGGVFCLLTSVGFFLLFVVGVHASIYETEN